MEEKIIGKWIERGINVLDERSVFIHPYAVIGVETTLYPNVYVDGATRIGSRVTIYPNVRIINSKIEDTAVIKDSTVIEESRVKAGAVVGPFAHLRPGSEVGADARIGNFVELKKTRMGKGSKASHLSYLGDARIGSGVNIGAGTITCNYDGEKEICDCHRRRCFRRQRFTAHCASQNRQGSLYRCRFHDHQGCSPFCPCSQQS